MVIFFLAYQVIGTQEGDGQTPGKETGRGDTRERGDAGRREEAALDPLTEWPEDVPVPETGRGIGIGPETRTGSGRGTDQETWATTGTNGGQGTL